MVHRVYPTEHQFNKANSSDTEATFLDFNLSIHNDIFFQIYMINGMILFFPSLACYRSLAIIWFLFGEVSSSSWCLGWAAIFYCGTLWTFHIINLMAMFLSVPLKVYIYLNLLARASWQVNDFNNLKQI